MTQELPKDSHDLWRGLEGNDDPYKKYDDVTYLYVHPGFTQEEIEDWQHRWFKILKDCDGKYGNISVFKSEPYIP